MLAMILKQQELQLDQPESELLAKAMVDVSSHYGFQPSSKAVAWTNLIMVAGAIYGTRLVAIRNNRIATRRETRAAQTQQKPDEPVRQPDVTDLRPANGFVHPPGEHEFAQG